MYLHIDKRAMTCHPKNAEMLHDPSRSLIHRAQYMPDPALPCCVELSSSQVPSYVHTSMIVPISLPVHLGSKPHHGLAHPPATSTHSAMHDPCFPSTSTISVSHLHRHPTPFSFTGSQVSQYSSSSFLALESSVVFSRKGERGIWRAGALAGQCWMVVCR